MKNISPLTTAVVTALLLSACATTSETRVQPADIASKTDVTQRAQIHTERAAEYFRMDRMAVALEAAEQAIQVAPQYAPAYDMLALIRMHLGENAKAQVAFEQALRLAPNDSNVLNNYGWFQCQRQSAAASLPFFERALLNPLYSSPERAHLNAGVCARKAGDPVRAEAQLQASLRRAPQSAAALFELADLVFSLGRVGDAEVALARYMASVQQASAEGLFLGVKVARAKGDRSAESDYVTQLRRRFPDAPQTLSIANKPR